MCGIAGILNFDRGTDLRAQFLSVSSTVLKNRGPNHFGYFEKDALILAHTRLSVIDISERSNQPMLSKSGKSAIVFNGEIFNYRDLQKQVAFPWRTNSDTEVILELYEMNGIEQCLKMLNGQFAFAIADFSVNKIFLARDRFGQAPLYYCNVPSFTFSSDIRLMTAMYKKSLHLDNDSLDYYLSEMSVPQPHSIWKEVKQVEPGQYCEIKFGDATLLQRPYWKLEETPLNINEELALEKITNALQGAICKRTISDVPVGCFLSGGVDSGLIVSMLAATTTEQIKTFTVGFDFEDYNELKDAQIIAKRYNTKHHEFLLSPDILADVDKILDCYGEPFGDSSAIPTYYISREIKKHVTVALSGDGGDEMFGGYVDYGYCYSAEKFATNYPSKGFRSVAGWASKVGSRISANIKNAGSDLEYLKIPPELRLHRKMAFPPSNGKYFVDRGNFAQRHFAQVMSEQNQNSATNALMKASLKTRLLNDYLVKVDRAAMANSLEVRCPFLDHELAELAFSLPMDLKFKNGELKYLLKKLGEKFMYPDIFSRKKRGFGIPVGHWLKKELYHFASDHISDLIGRATIVNRKAEDLMKEHCTGKKDHTDRIWTLVCLEIWMKNNL